MAKTAVMQRYIDEIDRFATLLSEQQDEIKDLQENLSIAKANYEHAKDAVREAKEIEHNTVSLLLKFIKPGSIEIMPLFDSMDKADDELHGENSEEWRREPISVLGLSASAVRALIDAEIVLVGQLQDRMLNGGSDWYKEVEGITSAGMADAINCKLHDYINEQVS